MIDIFMMMIAIASSIISYLVYKENSLPDVIVYLEQDEDALAFLNLVIKNVGKSAARDVSFKISSPLFEKVFQGKQPQLFIAGIPFLGPNASRTLPIHDYKCLSELLKNEKIEIETNFYKANLKSLFLRLFSKLFPGKIKNVSYLEVYSLANLSASDNSNGKKIVDELTGIKEAIKSAKKTC